MLDERFEYLEIITKDKIALEGIVYEPKQVQGTLLFFGGRSQDSVGVIIKLSQSFPQQRIVTFNYRSYGKSEGKVNESNLYSDAQEIALKVQKYYGDFSVLGFSLGSIVAGYISQTIDIKNLFLVGAFDSLKSLTKVRYGFRLPLLRYKFDLIQYVENLSVATFLFIGKEDQVTYVENGRNLKNKIKNLVVYKEIEGVSHQELLFHKDVVFEINQRCI